MNTIANEPAKAGRRRRRHSAQFKSQAVAACRHAGVSIAAIAMTNGINANLLRRWILDADQAPNASLSSTVSTATPPSFIPMALAAPAEHVATQEIRIELRRGTTAISVTWPTSAAADCAAWMRELLQ